MASTSTDPAARSSWVIPRSVLGKAVRVAVLLGVPLFGAYALAGLTATLGMAMGYVGSIAPALMLPRRPAAALTVLPAMTGAVSVAVNGQPFATACFVAMACLLVAPANMIRNGFMAGLPSVASVLALIPATVDPLEVAAWMLVGGLVAVAVIAPLRVPTEPVGVDPRSAWTHAVVMGAAVGVTALLVVTFEVPHGFWICLTLTVVLRPYGVETLHLARERVVATIGGAALALAMAVVVPGWAALIAVALLLLLMVAYALIGRTSQQVVFVTPVLVFLASGAAGAETLTVALERVLTTMLGALVAALIALALARRDRMRPDGRDPAADPAPPASA